MRHTEGYCRISLDNSKIHHPNYPFFLDSTTFNLIKGMSHGNIGESKTLGRNWDLYHQRKDVVSEYWCKLFNPSGWKADKLTDEKKEWIDLCVQYGLGYFRFKTNPYRELILRTRIREIHLEPEELEEVSNA